MKRSLVPECALVLSLLVLPALPLRALDDEDDEGRRMRAHLSGFQEVPALSTTGRGEFRGTIKEKDGTISYRLSYSDLESSASSAHIHFAQSGVAGGIIAFLCGGGGKPACPATSGTVEGTIVAADILGPVAQGIAAGDIQEAIRAIRSGNTYANVHTAVFPSGEIRGQIRAGDDDD